MVLLLHHGTFKFNKDALAKHQGIGIKMAASEGFAVNSTQ